MKRSLEAAADGIRGEIRGWMRVYGVNANKRGVTGSQRGFLPPKNLLAMAKAGIRLGIKGNSFQICSAGKRWDSSPSEVLVLGRRRLRGVNLK